MTFRVGIIGSEGFPEADMVRNYIKQLPRDTTILIGAGDGLAEVAAQQAQKEALTVVYAATDEQLLESVDWVVGYWDGRGDDRVTRCIRQCYASHTPHAIFSWDPETEEMDGHADLDPAILGFRSPSSAN